MTTIRRTMLGGAAVAAAIALGASAVAIRVTAAPKPKAPTAVVFKAAPPVLSGVPKGLKASDEPQALLVGGHDLSDGMTATVETPGGMLLTYGASVIDAVTPTTFRLRVPFPQPGTYALSVHTRGGARSNDIALTVGK